MQRQEKYQFMDKTQFFQKSMLKNSLIFQLFDF